MSVHTTKKSSWCRPCRAFIPPSMTFDEHDEKVHGIKPPEKSKSKSKSPPPKNVEQKKEKVPAKTGTSRTPSRSAKRKPSLHSPDAALKSIKKATPARSSVLFLCKTCGRTFSSSVAKAKHMRSHTVDVAVDKPKVPAFLQCYECNTKVEKEIYISHLMFHDAERNENGGKKMEFEQVQRKYLYLKPDDPRKNSPNAILQCPACPTSLFFSMKTFESHIEKCKKFQMEALAIIKSEPTFMDTEPMN